MTKPREFWIYKGTSNFCNELEYNYETDTDEKSKTDGFYDVVSEKDTIEGGIHVIEYSALEAEKAKSQKARAQCAALVEVLAFYANPETWAHTADYDFATLWGDSYKHKFPGDTANVAGKKAREALAAYKAEPQEQE